MTKLISVIKSDFYHACVMCIMVCTTLTLMELCFFLLFKWLKAHKVILRAANIFSYNGIITLSFSEN